MLIYYGSADLQPLLKLLAVFIGIEKLEDFPKCIKEGMSDQCLPMTTVDAYDGHRLLFCQHHKTRHTTINEYSRPNVRTQFMQWSYSLIAPYIMCSKQKHSHYHLHADDVFPMPVVEGLQGVSGQDNRATPTFGGYSEVYQVRINKSHQRGFFALKKLASHDRGIFDMELSSLIFCMDKPTIGNADKHIIQPLVTFEVEGPKGSGSVYYILFDWAEGNLSDFWKKNDHLVGARDHCKWMSRELYLLCLALECVHNAHGEMLKSIDKTTLEKELLGRPHDTDSLYGRHGDIKPDNFLWFGSPLLSESLGKLTLSDFGLGKLHTQLSRSNQDPRKIPNTETYRAPEFDLLDGKISRASDIFSLGCVYLEYVTWFLLGSEVVAEEFPAVRSELDIHKFTSDTFFIIRANKQTGKQQPLLKKSVENWIETLQSNKGCSRYLHKFLDLIRDKMLVPERESRIPILLLIKDMDTLCRECERDDSFYLKAKGES
ncbi:kinase-like protein [Daldinia grandis]|nr:kinase-like protein [Daldinia grandis]